MLNSWEQPLQAKMLNDRTAFKLSILGPHISGTSNLFKKNEIQFKEFLWLEFITFSLYYFLGNDISLYFRKYCFKKNMETSAALRLHLIAENILSFYGKSFSPASICFKENFSIWRLFFPVYFGKILVNFFFNNNLKIFNNGNKRSLLNKKKFVVRRHLVLMRIEDKRWFCF